MVTDCFESCELNSCAFKVLNFALYNFFEFFFRFSKFSIGISTIVKSIDESEIYRCHAFGPIFSES